MILTDVTLRDGLQAESQIISLEHKLELLNLLSHCQFSRLEVTSFVNPKWIPQLSDSEKLCEAWFKTKQSQETMAFVPNVKGCERLVKFPIPWVSCFVAASSTFNQKNINASIEETLKELEAITSLAKSHSRKVRIYISTLWGCPYEGNIDDKKLESIFQSVSRLDADEIALSDTIGVATPGAVKKVLSLSSKYFSAAKTALHFHNTYGFALANIQAGLEMGIQSFDGSLGGVGGCPYAKGATGNAASDDIRNLLFQESKISSFPKKEIEATLNFLKEKMGLTLHSSLANIQGKGGTWYGLH